MKVQVKDLRANPYRKIDKYPIVREKVETLKTSIDETTFWDNLLARKRNGWFEIAYGHHRLIALQESGIVEVDIPIRDLSDAQMIKIMANENLDEWKMNPAVYTETVLVAKEFLDGELAKYETWETSNGNIRCLFESQRAYESTKARGVGQTTILKFLGGNWKQWIIQDALDTIKAVQEDRVNRKAINVLPSTQHSKIFKIEVKRHKIPKGQQVGLAKTIKRLDISKREMPGFIKQHVDTINPPAKEPTRPKKSPTLDQYADEVISMAHQLESKLIPVIPHLDDFQYVLTEKRFFGALKFLHKVIEEVINKKSMADIRMLKP